MSRYRRVWIREYEGKRGTTYRVCLYDPDKRARRTVRTFQSKRIAQGFRDKYQAFLNGEGPNPAVPEPGAEDRQPKRLWSAAVTEWTESGATKETTRSNYRSLLTQFGNQAGIACVEDVTEKIVARFLARLKQQGRSLATCAAYLRTLAAFFSWATQPASSPITSKLISRWAPYKDRKRARPHYYTSGEYQTLLSACDAITVQRAEQRNSLWWKCYIAILYHAGLRLNEAAHLIWQDIDFEKGIFTIQPHTRLKGVFEWRPKGKSRRGVPVPEEVMKFLAQMQEQQQEGIPYVFLSKSRYLEFQRKGCPHRDILCGIGKTFKRIRNAADISEGMIHDMRRTCITNWARQPGLTPKDVQILAGHEDLNTTLDIYTMVEEEDVVEKARKIISGASTDAPKDASNVDA